MTVPEDSVVALRIEELTPEQIDLLKTTYAKGATDLELKLFVSVCNALQLSPFIGQIHAVKRWSSKDNKEVMAYQTGIGGFRLQAQRSKSRGGPEYRGQTDPMWCDNEGNWTPLWLKEEPPFAARVGVHVEGFVEPIYAIAEYSRLVQKKADGKPNAFWSGGAKAAFQLGKCAEAAAIRRAFPYETSRLYLEEEMYQIPEEKDITPPMTVDDAKKALIPPPVTPESPSTTEGLQKDHSQIAKKPAAQPGASPGDPGVERAREPLAGATPPKGEAIVPPEVRQKVIEHLQAIGLVDMPPPEMTEIEANMILGCKSKKVAGGLLDKMAISKDTQGKMV